MGYNTPGLFHSIKRAAVYIVAPSRSFSALIQSRCWSIETSRCNSASLTRSWCFCFVLYFFLTWPHLQNNHCRCHSAVSIIFFYFPFRFANLASISFFSPFAARASFALLLRPVKLNGAVWTLSDGNYCFQALLLLSNWEKKIWWFELKPSDIMMPFRNLSHSATITSLHCNKRPFFLMNRGLGDET